MSKRPGHQYSFQGHDMLLTNKQYSQQYSHLYYCRLASLRPMMTEVARQRWPDASFAERFTELAPGQSFAIMGTVYKEMPLKPSVLDQISTEVYVSDEDSLILEDESGRVDLTGEVLRPAEFCTGTVVAFFGEMDNVGSFLVQDSCTLGFAPQRPLPEQKKSGGPRYVLLASGLNLGAPDANPGLCEMLIDWAQGVLGEEREDADTQRNLVRVVLAGNNCCSPEKGAPSVDLKLVAGSKHQEDLVSPLRELDVLLTQLGSAVDVDVMPGKSDLSSYTLPQQPISPSLLPHCSRLESVQLVTNPHLFEVDGVSFAGSSGQPLGDLARYVGIKDRLSLMEKTLEWRHMAPTAPDTLGCYPFMDTDPFIMTSTPHVYFSGNEASFGSKLVQGGDGQSCLLVLVPDFSKTGDVALVDLHQQQVTSLHFASL